ncbi:hypothetical protein [Nocardia sp. CY41]|nr:hypothetical protein [Nocardia sp. CY41]
MDSFTGMTPQLSAAAFDTKDHALELHSSAQRLRKHRFPVNRGQGALNWI